ncbi:MAG: response regulator [Anaerolineae bacterium]
MAERASAATPIRVLVADDHAILRDGIRSLLERQPDFLVVGEAGNGQEAVDKALALAPDVVLMDLAMPGMDGLEATRRLRQLRPEIKVLILTQHDNREYIAPALRAGAVGYVLKRSGGREVVNAIRRVFEEGAFVEPEVAQKLVQTFLPGTNPSETISRLTERELQVLRLVVQGLSNKEIARALLISPKTASVHRTNIMSKLGVRNSIDLMRYVMQHHLLEG